MIDGFLIAKLISFWLFGFSTLLSIINPFGIAFVFHDMTRWLTPQERSRLARQIATNSFIVLVVALFLGSRVLSFFGISLEALRIGGGWPLPPPDGPCCARPPMPSGRTPPRRWIPPPSSAWPSSR